MMSYEMTYSCRLVYKMVIEFMLNESLEHRTFSYMNKMKCMYELIVLVLYVCFNL
jgi:hypothetical protein